MEIENKWNNWLRKHSRKTDSTGICKCRSTNSTGSQSPTSSNSEISTVTDAPLMPERTASGAGEREAELEERVCDACGLPAPPKGHRRRASNLPRLERRAKLQSESSRRVPKCCRHLCSSSGDEPTLKLPINKSNVATIDRGEGRVPPHPPISSSRIKSPAEDNTDELIRQPETRPISQEQLVAEVKGIYAGLVMVESKCIEVDEAPNAPNDSANALNHEQWQALIALHRTLLHEHHDFFLASQHPSASPALRRLASKYAMPARMWRHGIHSFLELLRHRLPGSLEHMLTFIYLAYSMMALLYETVPAFEDTWIECLGDLGRYRMAIEDDDIRDRESWTAVSRHWYSKASEKSPTTGRLYHHLAILARPIALQQLSYYTKSLCVTNPFVGARESIMALFDPMMSPGTPCGTPTLRPQELDFVRCHAIMFEGRRYREVGEGVEKFLDELDRHAGRFRQRSVGSEHLTRISNIATLLSYGNESNTVFEAIRRDTNGGDIIRENNTYTQVNRCTRWYSSTPLGSPKHLQAQGPSYSGHITTRKGWPRFLRSCVRIILPSLFVTCVIATGGPRQPVGVVLSDSWAFKLAMGASAAGSFTTGVWAKLTDEESSPGSSHNTVVAKILAIISSLLLAGVLWAYVTCYLPPSTRGRFARGFMMVAVPWWWISTRGSADSSTPPPAAGPGQVRSGSGLWHDINIGGLVSLFAGVLNVEASLLDVFWEALLKQIDKLRGFQPVDGSDDLENQRSSGGNDDNHGTASRAVEGISRPST